MTPKSDFAKKVIKYIQQIPSGKIATYGQIAGLAGKPQGSRGVAWILHSCSTSHKLPWHRVMNTKGKISFPAGSANFKQQRKFLEKEGVEFLSGGQLDLAKFQWKKKPAKKRATANRPQMFSSAK